MFVLKKSEVRQMPEMMHEKWNILKYLIANETYFQIYVCRIAVIVISPKLLLRVIWLRNLKIQIEWLID